MSAEPQRRSTPRLGIIIVLAVVVAVGLWLILRGGDDDDGSAGTQGKQPVPQQPGLPPVTLGAASLKNYAAGQTVPIYWVGPQPKRTYEVTKTGDGSTYIRYLPQGVKPGDPRPSFLTIGSYPNKNALQSVRDSGAKKGFSITKVAGNGEAVTNTTEPARSVYLAFPDSKVLIEVWDPRPGRSLELVRSGAVVPVR